MQEDMNWEQRRVASAVSARRKPSVSSGGGVEGPFLPLVYVPQILDRLQFLGEHCRFNTSFTAKLRELAIIITARHVSAQLEFYVHAMEAREFGLDDSVIDAIIERRQPEIMDADEALIYHFCTALHKEGRVNDELFARFEERFGKGVAIDVILTCGYYGTLGLVINVAKPDIPKFLGEVELPFPVPND
jgi:4-carboxymuconolactone decarboxylase